MSSPISLTRDNKHSLFVFHSHSLHWCCIRTHMYFTWKIHEDNLWSLYCLASRLTHWKPSIKIFLKKGAQTCTLTPEEWVFHIQCIAFASYGILNVLNQNNLQKVHFGALENFKGLCIAYGPLTSGSDKVNHLPSLMSSHLVMVHPALALLEFLKRYLFFSKKWLPSSTKWLQWPIPVHLYRV